MTNQLPKHPLTGASTFRNPASVSVATWEVVSMYGDIAHITISNGELDWIEKAWRELEKSIWVQHSDAFEWHRVMIRYFALVELVHIYCHLADIQSYEPEYKYGDWVYTCDLSKVKLAVLCGEPFLEDQYVGDEGEAYETVDHLLKEEYSRVVGLVETSLGGFNAMLKSLYAAIESNEDEITVSEDACLDFEKIPLRREVINLSSWSCDHFSRGGRNGYC